MFGLERQGHKQTLSHMPTQIVWGCLECCVEKDSEAALGLIGSGDRLVTILAGRRTWV